MPRGSEPDESQHFHRLGAPAHLIAPERSAVHDILPRRDVVMDVKARDHVVEHRQLLEQPDFLECARDTEPHPPVHRQADEVDAVEDHPARIRLIERRSSG